VTPSIPDQIAIGIAGCSLLWGTGWLIWHGGRKLIKFHSYLATKIGDKKATAVFMWVALMVVVSCWIRVLSHIQVIFH
jgi:hypothetical protein